VAVPFIPPLGEGGGRAVEGRGGAGEARGVAEVVAQHRQGLHRPWGGGGGLHIVTASVVCFAGSPPLAWAHAEATGGEERNRISSQFSL